MAKTVNGTMLLGGEGSGNFGHAGRPGEIGGSAPDGTPGGTKGDSGGGSDIDDTGDPHEFAPIDYVREAPDKPDLGTERPTPIKTKDLGEAVQLILKGEVVELHDTKAVHTVLNKLADIALEAKAKNEKAPYFDLCKVSVAGSKHLFCGSSLRTKAYPNGIPRVKMPQLGGEPVADTPAAKLPRDDKGHVNAAKEFVRHLESRGVKTTSEAVPASSLKASQVELVGPTVAGMMTDPEFDPGLEPIFVSSDNYVLDGHHRWAAVVGRDAENGKLDESRMNIIRVDAPISELLRRSKAWTKKFGIKEKAAGKTSLRMIFDGSLDAFLTPYFPKIKRLANGEPLAVHSGTATNGKAIINLPDISDVKFPSMIGAMPSTATPKRKKKRPVKYKGVKLSRKPTHFEVEVLSLTEIPPRLDAAVAGMMEGVVSLAETVQAMADYGASEVCRELVRQGADRTITPPPVDVTETVARLERDRFDDQVSAKAAIARRLARTHLTGDSRDRVVAHLLSRREPATTKRQAAQAVNEGFALGRRTAIGAFRRRGWISLAYKDEDGKFISDIEAVNSGLLAIDAVIQTAVMDTNTCDECSLVDGEVMEYGDKRQQELHPPYILCHGGDRCRCLQIAILANGKEIDVDEIDEDTIETGSDDF